MANGLTDARGHNNAAMAYMLAAVLFYSFIPLVIAGSNGVESPFLFNAVWRCGVVVGCFLTLFAFYWRLLLNRNVLRVAAQHTVGWAIFWATIGNFDYALFAWSTRFVDISISTVLFETWPIAFILLTAWLLREENAYRKNILSILPFLLWAFVGFVFIIVSQTGNWGFFDNVSLTDIAQGILLALLAALAASLGAFPFVWGRNLVRKLPDKITNDADIASLNFFGTILGFGISSFFVAGLNTGIGFSAGEVPSFDILSVGVAGGLLFHAPASILLRKSNLATNNLGINSLGYAIPIFSLIWLAIFSEIRVERVDYLIIGASAIVIANLLINFEAEIRWGFKALILALGASGVFVHLRDDIFELLGVDKWHWTTGGYFEALALSATVFTLLLAFRVARLISRTGDEENRTFDVFRKLDLLAQRGVIDGNIRDCILRIDAPKDQNDLENAYGEARNYIAAARANVNDIKDIDLQLLTEAEANLDALVRSKQQDITPGEMFALFIFAGITVSLTLLSRPPDAEGWNRLLVDIFAILISAVIIFLVVNVWDLRRERDESKLELRLKSQDYMIQFSDTKRRSFDQWLSIVVGTLIVLVYAGLLSHKWVGWFPWLG